MATFTADRPAFSFSGQADTDLATTSAALADVPTDFASMDSGGVDLAASTVTTTNHADDTLGCEIRIMNGATVLAAGDSGGAWVTLASNTAGPTSSINTNVIDFAYVNTGASEATWNGASVEYRQRHVKLKGNDACYVSSSAITNNITFTYTQKSTFNLLADNISSATTVSTPSASQVVDCLADNISSATTVSTPDVGQIHNIDAGNIQSASTVSTPAIAQEHVLLADNIQSATTVSVPDVNEVTALLADNVSAATAVSTPALAQEHTLLANNIQSATNTKTVTLLLDYEILRPDADVTVTGWTDEGGASTNLYQSIDEPDTPNDTDYVQSPVDPVLASNEYEHSLTNHTGPEDQDGLHRVRYRIRKFPADSKQMNLEVRLKQGVTTIATWSHTNVSGTWTTVQQSLTAPQKSSITDYDDLRLEYKADQV